MGGGQSWYSHFCLRSITFRQKLVIFRGRPSEKHPVATDIAWTLKPSSVWFRSWRFHELLCSVSMNQWLQYGPEVWIKPVKCVQKRSRTQLLNFWIGKEKPEHGMSCRLHGMDWIGLDKSPQD